MYTVVQRKQNLYSKGLFLLLISIVFILTSCQNKKSDNVLRIGMDDTYPPMEYKNEKNESVGFDVDFAGEIAKKLNKRLEIVSGSWDGLFQAMNTNKFDCMISGVSITKQRQKNYIFSKPYLANGQVLVVPPMNGSINKLCDLEGKKIGVLLGSTSAQSAEKYQKKFSFELIKYNEIIQTFSDLLVRRLDAIVVDEVVGREYILKNPKLYKISDIKLSNEPIGICFRKNDEILRDSVQKAVDEIKSEGRLKAISEKWFRLDLTTNVDEFDQTDEELKNDSSCLSNIVPLLEGAVITLELTFFPVLFGIILGLFLALGRLSKNKIIDRVSWTYIWIFRGTPLLMQIFFIYYALPSIYPQFTLNQRWAAYIALALNSAAYLAEIIRAAIQSIDRGQMEAAKALGMSYYQAMAKVIIPQSYRRLIPPVGNEFIALLKDSALVSVIGMTELMRTTTQISNATGNANIYIPAAILYLALTTVITYIFGKFERRYSVYE